VPLDRRGSIKGGEYITAIARPTGKVTFLLTDIEGSTRLLQRLEADYAGALAQHHRLMRQAIADAGGSEVKTEGDSFFVVFPDAPSGTKAAVDAQRLIGAASWPDDAEFSVRMGLHSGEVTLSDGGYVGVELHRAARIASTAHGGQIVVSASLRDALGNDLPRDTSLHDLGHHHLKDFDEPVHLYQLDIEGLRTDFPPLASLAARFDLLPPDLSAFVGREDEVREVSGLLSDARLLTMTGPGGTGKTRLALQAARNCEGSYAQGVAFVPLAPISDPRLVASTIRRTLGFSEEPGESSIDTLTGKLRHHEMLLILDNFEQVMPATDAIGRLLTGTEQLTVMVTSRASLHLDGEQEFSVPPLRVPRPEEAVDIEEIGRSEAVRLFVERAGRVRAGFKLDEGNANAIALICQRLDGLPLAIELAASLTKLLSPDQLLSRLSKSMDVLGNGGGQRGDRRSTLRGTIGWSHDLLSAAEQVAFRRLSVFVGGASLEAIEAIVPTAGPGADDSPGDVLASLSQLVDHSLVRSIEGETGPRFQMLETIREYGLERLDAAGEANELSEAHARHYLDRVAQLAPAFTSDPTALDEVETDHANVRAALRWARDRSQAELALRSVFELWRFWYLRGRLREGLDVCEDVLAMPGAAEPSEAASAALYARASLYYWQDASAPARVDYEASLEMAREVGSLAREAEAEFELTYAYMIAKEFDAAHEAARGAAARYDQLGDRLGNANARSADAYASALEGDLEGAVRGFETAIADLELLGDRFWVMNNRITLAWTLIRLGRLDEARGTLLQNLDGSIQLGDRSMENMSVQGLAMIAAQEGDAERALQLSGAADRIADELGGRAPSGLVVALDPVMMVRDAGTAEADITRLTEQGRKLDEESVRDLARGNQAPPHHESSR
jgi:predicted ATPase/class 3 adenylate cyclase